MARRSFVLATWTPVAVADTVNFTDGGYCALQGGAATQRVAIHEVFIGGQATGSSPTHFLLARDSTVGATLTALGAGQSDEPLDPSTPDLAAPVVPFTASTTKPQRSATAYLLNRSFNAYGGYIHWQAGPGVGEQPMMYGASASFGEISLSARTGGTPGLVGSHIIYEPL